MTEEKFEVVIACGGYGSRLREITKDIPKPLFPINYKNTLTRSLEELKKYGIKNVILTTNYKSNYFIDNVNKLKEQLQLNIYIFQEKLPLGECGSLWLFSKKLSDNFIFLNGDLIFSIDFKRLFNFHKRTNANLTLVTHTSDHPEDSDLISSPNGSLVEEIFLKSYKKNDTNNAYLGNSGISVINKKILTLIPKPTNPNESSVFNYLVKNMFQKKQPIYSYNTTEYIKDMGTPNRFKKVEEDLKKGNVLRKNYSNRQKALFIDRDNTIINCKEGKYIIELDQVSFLDKNISKLREISKKYDLVCIVTNQPQISMGNLCLSDLNKINSFIIKYCLSKGLKIDIVTFCPHHPEKGFEGEIAILKNDCFCRKPNPGLFIEQSFLRNIDLGISLMVGDSKRDQLASKNAGCGFKFIQDL